MYQLLTKTISNTAMQQFTVEAIDNIILKVHSYSKRLAVGQIN